MPAWGSVPAILAQPPCILAYYGGGPPSQTEHTVFRVVFTLPAEVADIALQNKAAIYGLLFQAASETMTTIAADRSTLAPASASPRCCTHGDRP